VCNPKDPATQPPAKISKYSLCAKYQLSRFKTVGGDRGNGWTITPYPYLTTWKNFSVMETSNSNNRIKLKVIGINRAA